MSVLGACKRRPILGRKFNFGACTIYGGKAACQRWRKNNMSKTREKQRNAHVDKPSHDKG
jgi:hypothetical protein